MKCNTVNPVLIIFYCYKLPNFLLAFLLDCPRKAENKLKMVVMNKSSTITVFFFKFCIEVGVEESIVNAPPQYNYNQLFKSNPTFCIVCVFNRQFEKSVFLRRVVHSQSNSSMPTSTPNKKKNTFMLTIYLAFLNRFI
jgi:hypothetical protein